MRKAITAPLPDQNTLNPCIFGLLARNFQTKRKQSKSFWQKLSDNQETDEVESNEGSSIRSDSPPSFKEPLHRALSARFEDYLRRRMLLRDLLDPQHINSILKMSFYTIMGVIVFVLVGYAILTLREDIMKKKAYEMEVVMSEINQCTKEYFDNKCEPATRIPPIQEFCMEKEKCMLQDPDMAIRGTKITFALIGEALNELINPLSWKTILVLFAICVGSVYAVNHSLGYSNQTQNFRQTFEYDEINSRLKRIERFSVQKDNFCIQDERRR